jgi:hypothetical protein
MDRRDQPGNASRSVWRGTLGQDEEGLIAMHGRIFVFAEKLIRNKARRLRTATAILVTAVFFVAAGGGR